MNRGLPEPPGGLDRAGSLPGVLTQHPAMLPVIERVRLVAPTRAPVLLCGEPGTGKGTIARAIHELSPRKSQYYGVLNCSALTESLLESELFGHERGAFTGATARRRGRFELADAGTLLLGEIADVPLPAQVKLLRFLQERQFEPVGGNESIRADVRLIAATNKDLPTEVERGRFRTDLFYRLNVVTIRVPALRERPSDIPILAERFARHFASENEKQIHGFAPEAERWLLAYDWPGNVRELEHTIERAVVLSQTGWIETEHLPDPQRRWVRVPGSSMAEIERDAILRTVASVEGDTARAAAVLGISRRKIQYRLREYRESRNDRTPRA